MKFTLCAIGTRGDVAPFLALGRALVARNAEVVVAAPPEFASDAAEAGLDFRPIVPEYLSAFNRMADTMGSPLKLLPALRRMLSADPHDALETLLAIAEDSDAMLATGMAYIPANVAEALGIPYRMVVFCPQIYPSVYHPPPSGAAPRGRRLLNALLWWGMEGWFDRAVGPVLNPWRRDQGLNAGSGFYRRMIGLPAERVLSADEELAPLPPDVMIAQRVSAIRPSRGDSLPSEVEDFLALGTPPVYVGFGSVPTGDASRLLDIVLESATSLRVRTIVPTSWASAAMRDIPEGCLAVGHIPHDLLFPRLAAVVHHGGAGTTTAAARAGLPQVVIPHLTDQYYWGHRVCELGIGPGPLNYRRLTASTLTSALREALNSPTIAERAGTLYGSTNGRDGAVELATLLCEDLFATSEDDERQRTQR